MVSIKRGIKEEGTKACTTQLDYHSCWFLRFIFDKKMLNLDSKTLI